MNPIEFLEARLAEDEQIARTASDRFYAEWSYLSHESDTDREVVAHIPPESPSYVEAEYHFITADSEGLSPSVQPNQAHHIARFNPARILREVAAKRELLAETDPHISGWISRTLAAAYSNHPDYNPEWNPIEENP